MTIKKEIKELTDFLPLIYDEKITLYKTNPNGDMLSGGYYDYHTYVYTFFELASQPYWQDYQYIDNFSEKMIEPDKIEKSTMKEIKTILTWCVRSERFNEGHWISVIEKKIIKRVLERIDLISNE